MKLCPLCDTSWPNHHTNCENDGAKLIASSELEPGTVIRDKYRIVRALGRGGMGTVYLAEHILLGRQRALKFISRELSHDPKILKRFRLEAQAASDLRHPNIVEVVDLDQAEDGSPYIAMEYVEGIGLRQAITPGPLPVERAIGIARGVALGLGVAHARGIIHRDVKPENILLAGGNAKPEIPKLLDFGIAAIKESSTALSRTRGLMLTPEYAAPEQWKGMPAGELDGRVDLYALGGVLHEMLTGRTCFSAHNTEGWMYLHLLAEPASPTRLRPELAKWPGLDALVLRLLAKNREDRPAGMAEFVEELNALRLETPPAPGKNRLDTVFEPPPRKPIPEQVRDASARPDPLPKDKAPAPGHSAVSGNRALWWIAAAAISLIVYVAYFAFRSSTAGTASRKTETPVVTHAEPVAGTTTVNPKDGLTYVWIPPGSFLMGCSPGDTECDADEKPARQFSIAKGFWMGQTEVTQAAYQQVQGNNPSNFRGDRRPVERITWDQAKAYCGAIGGRLPTEAEWEYAARGGVPSVRYGEVGDIAWYSANSGSNTHEAGQKQANRFGLFDTLGNVWEWTADWYEEGKTRSLRGGSWSNSPRNVRVSNRNRLVPGYRNFDIGVRCVRE